MTPTPVFRQDDTNEALRFVAAHHFATIAVNGENGPMTALVPLVIGEGGQTLLGHVARANPFWKAAQDNESPAVAVFKGPDAYISPSSYPSKKADGRVVPTWNYMAVQIRGKIEIEARADAMMPYIEALTDKMESHRKHPWKVSDAPKEYIAKLSRAVVGFSLAIDEITYVRKLSQNKSDADKQGVMTALETSEQYESRLIAQEMRIG